MSRVRKIIQMDGEIGQVTAPVPVMVSRLLQRFIESVLVKTAEITRSKDAQTVSLDHLK